MDPALAPLFDLSIDSPWFVNVAAQPLLQLLEAYPHLNLTALALSQPPSPFRLDRNRLEKRSSCFPTPTPTPTPGPSNSGPSGALIGGIVAGVVVVLLLLILAFFLWRRRNANRKQQNPPPIVSNNNVGTQQPPMPSPYDQQGMNSGVLPQMKENDAASVIQGPNYTSTIYPAPNTPGGWSNPNTGSATGLISGSASPKPQERQSYYNYAPPPPDPQYPMPSAGPHYAPSSSDGSSTQWNPGMLGMGGTLYSGTPSPPPPSVTPGASSSMGGYAPWAIPLSTSPVASSTVGASSSAGSPPPLLPPGAKATFAGFPTAAEEKAHYTGTEKAKEARLGGGAPDPTMPGVGGTDSIGVGVPARVSLQTPAPPAYSAYTAPPPQ